MQTYAIGDIHGHLELLNAAHARIAKDRSQYGTDAPIVHVGDLVDRGPDSRGVIDYLMQGQMAGENWVVLKGNHDRMFALYLTDIAAHDSGLRPDLSWLNPRLGGAATLKSYGVRSAADRPLRDVYEDAIAAVPQRDRDYINALPTLYRRGSAAFVHAGIRPDIELEDQVETDLVWIREPFLSDMRDHGALIVHGHTAIDVPTHYGNRLNIDSGAAYGGPLSTVLIDGDQVFHLTDRGRVPLRSIHNRTP